MRKKFKIIITFLLIIFLTGCSGNYNLKINSDLSIDEDLQLTIKGKDSYQKTLDIFEENNIDKKNYDVSISEDTVQISYTDKFSSIEDYILNSKVYNQMFNKIEYNKKGSNIDLYVDENIKLKNNYNLSNGSNLTDFDVIQVNITNPFKVKLHNAEIVNDKVYTWSLTNNQGHKKIQMQFKSSLDKFPIKPVIVGSLIVIVSFILLFNLYKRYKSRQNV